MAGMMSLVRRPAWPWGSKTEMPLASKAERGAILMAFRGLVQVTPLSREIWVTMVLRPLPVLAALMAVAMLTRVPSGLTRIWLPMVWVNFLVSLMTRAG